MVTQKRRGVRALSLQCGEECARVSGMSRYEGEQVLVVPREAFNAVGAFNGVRRNPEEYLEAFLKPGVARYMDRALAEQSPEFKQLIAYAIFCRNGKILAYSRTSKGTETRLHDKWSLGIGGHINPIDGLTDSIHPYLTGMEREIREEISIPPAVSQELYAVINDDTDEVGSVHLGIVHRFELEEGEVAANEKKLDNLGFHTLEELAGPLYPKLESWSTICVDALKEDAR